MRPGPDRDRGWWGAATLAALAAVAAITAAAPVHADDLDLRLVTELEFLGESFISTQLFSEVDLGLPSDSPLLFADTTRFVEDTWLPGQRLELGWRREGESGGRLRLDARSAYNRERFSQNLDFEAVVPGSSGGRWLFRVESAFREDERSLVGHGDWHARVEMTREVPLHGEIDGAFRVGFEHSRTRGDSTSYLYDFDLLRARAFLSGPGGWLPRWESFLEGTAKAVPRGEPGAYRELRAGGVWRPGPGGSRRLSLDLRHRNYDQDDAVGRDGFRAEAAWRHPLWSGTRSSVELDTRTEVADYRGEDELYFDSAELAVHVPWNRTAGDWTLAAGPAARVLRGLKGGQRDYQQWTARGSVGRLVPGGFGEISVESGFRDYRAGEADVIEVSSLSSSLIRSDYWLFDLLAIVNLPLWAGVTVDLVASSSWEIHRGEDERIRVTFATLGLGRSF